MLGYVGDVAGASAARESGSAVLTGNAGTVGVLGGDGNAGGDSAGGDDGSTRLALAGSPAGFDGSGDEGSVGEFGSATLLAGAAAVALSSGSVGRPIGGGVSLAGAVSSGFKGSAGGAAATDVLFGVSFPVPSFVPAGSVPASPEDSGFAGVVGFSGEASFQFGFAASGCGSGLPDSTQ